VRGTTATDVLENKKFENKRYIRTRGKKTNINHELNNTNNEPIPSDGEKN
jgi:hypothetical protein